MTAVLNNSDSHGDDPLSKMIAPPPNETLLERDKRLRLEAEAKRISDAIDEQLRVEAQKKRKSPEVKLLLLGQSGSGKSTLQKQVCARPPPPDRPDFHVPTPDVERWTSRHALGSCFTTSLVVFATKSCGVPMSLDVKRWASEFVSRPTPAHPCLLFLNISSAPSHLKCLGINNHGLNPFTFVN